MHLVYFDESGQSGSNLNDPAQPVFTLAALVVPEAVWLTVEHDLNGHVTKHFSTRPEGFEIHATALRNGDGYFRQFSVSHRVGFRDGCLELAHRHGLKLIYRAIEKKRFEKWIQSTFPPGVSINPHTVAFPLVARVVDEYLKSLPNSPLGIFIADENREIIGDVEKSIRLLRGSETSLKLGQIIEKGFFIDSTTSLLLQLCDLCAYSARKKEEARIGLATRTVDQNGILLIEPLIHRGNEAFQDTLDWVVSQQKKERPGDKPGSVRDRPL
jgi:hypothetical protein